MFCIHFSFISQILINISICYVSYITCNLRSLIRFNYKNKCYVPSDITSLNQNDIEDISIIKAKPSKSWAEKKPCMVCTADVVRVKSDIQVNIGQGDGGTRWNGCAWKLLLIILVIIRGSLFFATLSYFVDDLYC